MDAVCIVLFVWNLVDNCHICHISVLRSGCTNLS